MKHTARQIAFHKTLKQDHQYTCAVTIGNRVYERARKSDGAPVFVEQDYSPTYYIPVVESQATHRGFDGTPLAPYSLNTIYEGKEFLEKNGKTVFGDIQCEYMSLHDAYGAREINWTQDRLYIWDIDIEVDSEGGYATPQNPWQEVTAITVLWRHMGEFGIVVYGRGDFKVNKESDSYKKYSEYYDRVTYVKCANEAELLMRFLDDYKSGGDYPDIITGWNVQFFDVPYLVARMKQLFSNDIVKCISPFERFAERTVILMGRPQVVIDIRGITVLDYLEMYKKLTYTQRENYRLDTIAAIELKNADGTPMRKLSYKEFRSLHELYRKNHQKFIEYNIDDVILVDKLDEKKKLLALVFAIAYTAKANFVDCFKQVRLWDIMIYHKLRQEGKQIPPRKQSDKKEQYAGAYVKEPKPGLYHWVCSFDVASMYPHIIREWNLSPETFADDHFDGLMTKNDSNMNVPKEELIDMQIDLQDVKEVDLCVAANGVMTRRDIEGFLPNMLKTLYDERNRYKKLMKVAKGKLEELKKTPDAPDYQKRRKELEVEMASCDNAQQVRKVNLNSAYGAMGSEYFRFFDVRMAEAVTVTGQLIIQRVARDINKYLNRELKNQTEKDLIVYSDTDSVYVDMSGVVSLIKKIKPEIDTPMIIDALNDFCNKRIMPVIEKTFKDIADYFNVATPCLSMVRDVIADKAVWTAKKRYIMNVYDSEGTRYKTPDLKMMGIETVKSSTPAVCRDMLKKSMNILMNGTQKELWDYIAKCEQDFKKSPFEDIAFPRSVNGLKKYAFQDKSVPIHVRGAKAFNENLERTNLGAYYEDILDGEKIKFAYLKKENPFFTHVMSAPDGCPPEWNIEQHIDYNQQFEKAFREPLNTILQAAGWSLEHEESLFD